MSLIALLKTYDENILHFFNHELAHTWNDFIFKLWTSEAPWFILAGIFFFQSAYRRQWQSFRALLWIGMTVGLTDFLTAQVLKPWIGRIRPCKVIEWIRIADGCAGNLSFPSNHAANGAAFAMFWFLWKGPKIGLLAVCCVAMVGLSRVYLGVHYPSDIIGGFCFGGLMGGVSYGIYNRMKRPE